MESKLGSCSIACKTGATPEVESSANSDGRRKGTSAPYCLAMSAISSSSVETTTLSSLALLKADSMVQTISGFPQNFFIFFAGYLLNRLLQELFPESSITNYSIHRRFLQIRWDFQYLSNSHGWERLQFFCFLLKVVP